jgi:hypothetical protein
MGYKPGHEESKLDEEAKYLIYARLKVRFYLCQSDVAKV